MNAHLPAPRPKWPGRLVNLAVVVAVLALAAATFVLSYPGVHAIAVQAGVSARLARLYPGLFDAVLVIACVAAVMLRDARWWARCYAWLVIIVVMAVVGAADATHAMNVALPHRKTEGVVAATPWVLVLLGFSLMLTMLRHSRAQHGPARQPTPTAPMPPAALALHATVPVSRPTVPVVLPVASALPPTVPALPATLPSPPTVPSPLERAASATEYTPDADTEAASADFDADIEAGPAEPPDGSVGTPAVAQRPRAATAQQPTPAAEQEPTAAAEQEPTAEAEQEPATPALVRATVAREPARRRHDYWDADEENGLREQNSPPARPELDPDAPPFATSPFATVPRLNRVRSTPVPPEDDEEA